MGRIGLVAKYEAVTDPMAPLEHVDEVTIDIGGGSLLTVEHMAPSGDDSPPLPNDYVVTVEHVGKGREAAVGYADGINAGVAAAGEVRRYARTPAGVTIAQFHMKGDGSITISMGSPVVLGEIKMLATGKVNINGHLTVEPK